MFDDDRYDDIGTETQRIIIPYEPRAWQADIHRQLRRFNVIVCHRGAGKALALDTIVPTPDGYTTMGEVQPGMMVIDRDGNACRVKAISGVMHDRECYEVVFNTGERVVCDGEHLWTTQTIAERQNENNQLNPRRRKENPQNTNNPRGNFTGLQESPKTVLQIRDTLVEKYVSKSYGTQQRNHRVRVTKPVQLPARELAVDPYYLGYWLGDGTSRTSGITVGAEDLAEFRVQMNAAGFEVRPQPQNPTLCAIGIDGRANRGSRVCLKRILRAMGVLQNKHIPVDYLRASEAQRWRLLQGLMDSDGSTSTRGGCEITLINWRLITEVQELVASLGLRPGEIHTSRATIDGRDVGERHRFGFQAYDDQPVFALPRKQGRLPARLDTHGGYQRNRLIVAVNPVPSVPVQCIEVESPSSTFCVTRSFIPTHNSVLCMNELIRKALSGPPAAEYVYLLPLRNQAKRNVWVPFKRFLDPIPGIHYDNAALEATLPNDSKIMVLGADNPESLRGLHLHGVVLDEFSDMHANTWRAIRPMLSNHNGWAIWIGTPKGHNEFYRKYMQSLEPNRPNWFGAFMPYWSTNALSDEEVEQMRTEMLPEEFAQELECSFSAALIGSYYGKQLSEQRDRGYISPNPLYRTDLEVYTAWDLGIRDKMAVWFFQLIDNEIAFIDFEQHSNFGFKEWKALLDLKKQHYWYQYAIHIAPFDIKNREIGSGISRLESAEQVGIRFEICPKQDIMDGIEIVRRHLPRCRFHSIMCEEGLEALMMYRAKVDRMGNGLGPQHDESSHASDSLRYAMTYVTQVLNKPAILRLPFLRNR